MHQDGETVETVADLIFLGSKITADGDCSHEIKRHLLLGRKVMTNLDSIFMRPGPIAQSPGREAALAWALVLSLLNGLSLTSICDYWKNHSCDYTDL